MQKYRSHDKTYLYTTSTSRRRHVKWPVSKDAGNSGIHRMNSTLPAAGDLCLNVPRRLTCPHDDRVPLQWPRTRSMSRVIGWTCHTAPSVCVIYFQSIIWPSVCRCWRVNSPTSSFSRRPLVSLQTDSRRLRPRPVAYRSNGQDRNFYI